MKQLSIFIMLVWLLTSCQQGEIFNQNVPITNQIWNKNELFTFEVDITDSQASYDLIFSLRHHSDIQIKDLLIEVSKKTPSDKIKTSNYVIEIRDSKTSTLKGEALGDICDVEQVVENGIKFSESGTYIFTLKHNMDEQLLPMIMEVGLIVRKKK
jgi:gliding motility-associated lipoprotein GldH